ncbi:bifunctional UDP-N-acetylglucosamine diphosphorylase/glucosamine-1-phosphate N-acetyltransferase GlmU [soil metagenome]
MTDAPLAVVVLAAGEGTRMKSATPKVLHSLAGRSMLGHVLAAAAPLGARHTVVVVGHGADEVVEHLAAIAPSASSVVQEPRQGSGHAAGLALAAVPDLDGIVVILNGDVPLLTAATLRTLVEEHRDTKAAMTVLTARVPDPTGLGRILRAADGTVTGIVEHREADEGQLGIDEVNAGAYVADAPLLREAVHRLSTDNSQGEQYLTDAIGLLVGAGHVVHGDPAADHIDTLGCNDRVELAARRRTLNDRILIRWMRAGVTVVDPATTWVDVDVELEPDVTLMPGTALTGRTRVGAGAVVGPDTTLTDCVVGPGASVVRSHCLSAEIGPEATVGPFSYLRPGTRLARAAKAGAFVEIKASDIGAGAKVPHLSYVGDASIGEGTNIGAATVFVNYDGVDKHRTTIGRHARTGADNMFVAPVSVGDGAYTAAGSVITDDVPAGAMAVARARQRNIAGWVRRRRAGSSADRAAAEAEQRGGEQ